MERKKIGSRMAEMPYQFHIAMQHELIYMRFNSIRG
jgi:hypothetical protein